jgi:large subunit ribosomal protein L5
MAKGKEQKEKKQKGSGAEPEAAGERLPVAPARVADRYKSEVIPAMMKRFNYKNINQVPRLEKIAPISVWVLRDANLKRLFVIEAIVGQGVSDESRKSISNFKLRENQAIGARVTLRRARMYEFLTVDIALYPAYAISAACR